MGKKKGIDISYHQRTINFNKVKNAGIEFIIPRSSYRTSTDPKFFEYVEKAKAAGIPILGVYHFSYALNKTQAVAEADLAISLVEKAGLSKDTVIFFDFEYDTVKKAKDKGVTLGKNQCNIHTQAFCNRIIEKGYPTGVYMNKDYYRNMYTDETRKKYPIWLADYDGDPDYPCPIQQYSSSGKVDGIVSSGLDMDYLFDNANFKISGTSSTEPIVGRYSRADVVALAQSWVGKKESDGSYKSIIDIYNSQKTFPRGVKMQYSYAWCACTWSALGIKLGYEDIWPIEMSCGYLVEQAKKLGCWQENDAYIPSPGDGVLYDWDDNGKGDNNKWPDHVGVVEQVYPDAGYFVTIEGNYSDQIKRRTVSINGKFIRGFITPNYDLNDVSEVKKGSTAENKTVKELAMEVISGKWGSGETRKTKLTKAGYDYAKVQAKVNEILAPSTVKTGTTKVTATCGAKKFDKTIAGTYMVNTEGTNCRNDAGSNKKSLCKMPKGTEVKNYGYYTVANGKKWLYIQFTMNKITYTGFTSEVCLNKK